MHREQSEFEILEAAIPHHKDRFEWTVEDHLPELKLMLKGLVEPEPTDEELRKFVQETLHQRSGQPANGNMPSAL